VLELIAEPSIAADALPVLLAAIEEGLGEEVEPLPQSVAPIADHPPEVLQAQLPAAVSRVWAQRPASPLARRILCRA
jgi:phosphocarrier protein FPr